jgi:hypothetical protein
MQNGFVESFNGSFRDECFNETPFSSLTQARTEIIAWKDDYNRNRPQRLHRGLQQHAAVGVPERSLVPDPCGFPQKVGDLASIL